MEAFPRLISNLRWFGLSGFVALGALNSSLVVAQNAQPPEPSTQLAEVIVTAQYREEKLQDTPIAISALTSDMIEQQGATRLSDILTSAPSVAFRQQSAAFGESVAAFIRGFGQADFDPAFEPGVGLYVDDVYYPRLTGANLDLMDVERVEVLRGPQGTLEGRNSEGGAIRFVTRKPTGYRALRATVRFNPSDQFDTLLSADYIRDRHNNGAEILLYGNNPNPNAATVNGLPFDSRFLCGRWCNYTTVGAEAGTFAGGAVFLPPANGLPMPATSG